MKNDYLEKILGVVSFINFLLLILVVFLQIFSRFLLPQSPSWTEEIVRILLIYSVCFAAPLALKQKQYVCVDLLITKLNDKNKIILNKIIYFMLSLFFLILTYSSVEYVILSKEQTSPAISFPMMYSYLSIVITNLFMAIYSIGICCERKKVGDN